MNRKYILILYLLFGCVLTAGYYLKRLKAIRGRTVDYSPQIYSPSVIPFALAAMVGLVMAAGFSVLDTLYGVVLPVLIDLFCYYLILIMMSGVLRNAFSGKMCAALWVLPNIMHVFVFPNNRPIPEIVIPLGNISSNLFMVWLIGFILVLGSRITVHRRVRNKLLSECSDEIDALTLEIWKEELAYSRAEIGTNSLRISNSITTPLTIGLFSVKVILPNRKYTEE